jgi:hypothetical protein
MVTFTLVMGEDDASVEFIPRLTMKRAKAFLVERHFILQYNPTKRLGTKYFK